MKNLKEKISEIDNIELKRDNNDGTKQYIITSSPDVDLRKKLFEILPKEEIVIFELKKTETTLEDAFIKIIDKAKGTEPKRKVENTLNRLEIGKKAKIKYYKNKKYIEKTGVVTKIDYTKKRIEIDDEENISVWDIVEIEEK